MRLCTSCLRRCAASLNFACRRALPASRCPDAWRPFTVLSVPSDVPLDAHLTDAIVVALVRKHFGHADAFTPKAAAMRSSTRAAARVRGRLPRARDLTVVAVLNARNAVEAAVLRVRERFDDGAYKGVLAPETLVGAEQDWLARRAGGRRRRQRGRAAARSVRRATRRV